MQIKPHAEAQSPQRKAGLYDVDVRPHPRIRKTIKYGGAALTVLLVVVWIGSGWNTMYWASGRGKLLAFASGSLLVEWMDQDYIGVARGFHFVRPFYSFKLWLPWGWERTPMGWSASIPIWVFACAASVPTALAFRLDTLARRRERGGVNLCPKCHYDRTGLAPTAVCPECGSGSNGGSPA